MKVNIRETEKKYDVIYADPPWEYKQAGARGTAVSHYEVMSTEEICELPVRAICTERAMCFMWATFPNITEAIKVLEAWGFEYKTAAFVWVKRNKKSSSYFWGMGAYTRANAEVCLLGISKGTRASEMVKRHDVHQIIDTAVERHSKKPGVTRRLIVDLLGAEEMNKIELFARDTASGWDCWGNEV